MKPKFIITTLGCKANQADSEAIAQDLMSCQWSSVQENEAAELCIVNTCTVTQKAAMQSRQAIRQAIRGNPAARIVVTGCYAETEADAIRKIKGVHDVVGQTEKHTIARRLNAPSQGEFQGPRCKCDVKYQQIPSQPANERVVTGRTRPFLKIQDGCDAFCTYCIVPYARGRSHSMSLENVLNQIKNLADAGYHEVVLTGIHIGNYGLDLEPQTSLFDLMNRIYALRPINRVRLSSIEPLELTPKIIKRIANSDIFCPHFHIPLQSGDNKILKKMHRPYQREYFKALVLNIKQVIPHAAIGVDVLIGFPDETQSAFENTYELVAGLPISYLHVFPFSPRPGTPASKYPNRVPATVIKMRCEMMRTLGSEKRKQFYRQFIGQEMQVVVESTRDSNTGLLKGITANYLPVLITAGDEIKNKLATVRIENLHNHKLHGSLCGRK